VALQEAFLRSLDSYPNLRACPVSTGFRILGKRWTIQIARQLMLGKRKFNDILKSTRGINPRILSLRLKELEELRLVSRRVFDGPPVTIEYDLTESGRGLIAVMYSMASFSMLNLPGRVFYDGRARTPEQVSLEIVQSDTAVRVVVQGSSNPLSSSDRRTSDRFD
jgi:DNA-binding HxlR family transcriptional regulator